MKKINAYINIVRPANFLITFFTVIVAAALSYQGEYSYLKVFLAAITASLTMSAGNIINDIYDLNGDKINHPGRPLPSGLISLKAAVVYYFILLAVSLILSLYISNLNFAINLLAVILLYLYSYKLKRIAFTGNVVVSILTGLTFIYGGLAVNNIYNSLIPALFAFLINLIREIVKDMEDVEGDIREGIISFPSKYGVRITKNTIIALSALLILFTIFPYINGNYGKYYIAVIIIIVIPVLVYFLISLIKDDSQSNMKKLSLILKLDMVFGLFALYIGK
jgi:geranylgeranylglycerol-phosphate geranylgeranyltransferase